MKLQWYQRDCEKTHFSTALSQHLERLGCIGMPRSAALRVDSKLLINIYRKLRDRARAIKCLYAGSSIDTVHLIREQSSIHIAVRASCAFLRNPPARWESRAARAAAVGQLEHLQLQGKLAIHRIARYRNLSGTVAWGCRCTRYDEPVQAGSQAARDSGHEPFIEQDRHKDTLSIAASQLVVFESSQPAGLLPTPVTAGEAQVSAASCQHSSDVHQRQRHWQNGISERVRSDG